MKKLYTIILIFVLPALIYPQVKVRDSVTTVTMEWFSVPGFPDILLNVKNVSYTAQLLDSKLEKIKDCNPPRQRPSKEEFTKKVAKENRGTTVAFLTDEFIEEAGIYYIKTNVSYVSENDGKGNFSDYYKITANYPTIASEVALSDAYYYGENETFSFATAEFSEYNEYSYKIMDDKGKEIEKGKGPIVRLNKLLNDPQSVGKKFIIHGLYRGKSFKYIDSKTNVPKKTEWSFTVNKPQGISEINAWGGEKDVENGAVWYIGVSNSFSKSFQFTYTSQRGNSFIIAMPECKNLSVTTEPEGLVQDFSYSKNGAWLYINITTNEDYLNNLAGDTDISLNISFQTQFEKIQRTYKATIF